MKTARSFIVILCLCAVLAAFFVFATRTWEVRRLEAAVNDEQHNNSTLLNELRTDGTQLQVGPKTGRVESAAPTTTPTSFSANDDASLTVLRHWLDLHPEKAIPEIGLVPVDFCRAVAATIRPGSEPDLRQGARMLRTRARQVFGEIAARAIADFADSNVGALPSSMSDLARYLDPAIDESILRRYQILARGNYAAMDPKAPLIGEVAGVDDDFDSVLSVSRTSLTKVTTDRIGAEIQRALHRYLSIQGGKAPPDTAVLVPYFSFPISEDIVSKYLINSDFNVSGKK